MHLKYDIFNEPKFRKNISRFILREKIYIILIVYHNLSLNLNHFYKILEFYRFKFQNCCVKRKTNKTKNIFLLHRFLFEDFRHYPTNLCSKFYQQPVLKRKECKRFQGFAKKKNYWTNTNTTNT